jgi:hypothetical protein
VFIVIASPPMLKLFLVKPSVATASMPTVGVPTIILKTVFVVFIAVCAVSHIHNCLLSVLLTPNNNPIPSPFVFVPV